MEPAGGGNGRNVYNKRYSADDLQNLTRDIQQNAMEMMGEIQEMGGAGVMDGRPLNVVMDGNNYAQQRRRSLQQFSNQSSLSNDAMAQQMMGFQSPVHSDYGGMNMPYSPKHPSTILANGGGIAKRRMQKQVTDNNSVNNGGLDTSPIYGMGSDAMTQSPIYQQSGGADQMNMDMNDMNEMALQGMFGGSMDVTSRDMDMFSQADFAATPRPGDGGMLGDQSMMDLDQGNLMQNSMHANNMMFGMTQAPPTAMQQPTEMLDSSGMRNAGNSGSLGLQPETIVNTKNVNNFSTGISSTQQVPSYPNAYSQSGFDMLSVLMRVAARPRPQINIGAVDMSCAFVVCDVTQHDVPIVYCSEMFERLTGYVKHEILGRNCRFLQAPDSKVQAGCQRKYVDDKSVYHLKSMIMQRQEAQISLINYRKGGQPFMNLLTMIPISWDTNEIRYYVGFQVDLVEQPTSITNKNPDGSYAINYQRGLLPRYIVQNTPETNRVQEAESGRTIDRDEVSSVLSTIGTGENEYSRRIWDKVVLENTDDVVHVLSFKGLFQYLSPSAKRILEYEPQELVGTPLSSVCHPSDIVPVTRELKDCAVGGTVNVVFRIRRKRSGYTWFESHGSMHTEQGKGKKCIILSGRERPVYALQRRNIVSGDDIGDNELWTKMSTAGMFLFVSTHAKSLLDRQPEDLFGTSIQTLMRPDSKEVFNRMLEVARGGKITTFKHDIQNRRGQTLHAQSTLYPGDASEGQKPTFIIAQTKLLKISRERASAAAMAKSSAMEAQKSSQLSSPASTPLSGGSAASKQLDASQITLVTSSGNNGLAIGNQDASLASDDNIFDELKTTRSTSWQFELRQMEKRNRVLAEELQSLNSSKKKRKRRKGLGQLQKDCANCHTRNTPEWRRGPSGNRDLCNSCGLRWAKAQGRVSPRNHSLSEKASASPANSTGSRGNAGSPSNMPVEQQNIQSHSAKTARMEATAPAGFGGGIPAKIEEGVEPD